MAFLIEKNIPAPPQYHSGKYSKYPFPDMDIGDSFFVVGEGDSRRAQSAATQSGKMNGRRYVTRKEADGRRIWRIA